MTAAASRLMILMALTARVSLAADAQSDEQPSAAMMAPVVQLATFMSRLPPAEHASSFARQGVCIVENFAPFVFCGRDAVSRWEAGFRSHASDLTELSATFGAAHDFSQSGGRVYFSLPTTWTGLASGRHFEEHGVWAFVLQNAPGAARDAEWRILSYGWGVNAYTESP
jgi:hypothetical protein